MVLESVENTDTRFEGLAYVLERIAAVLLLSAILLVDCILNLFGVPGLSSLLPSARAIFACQYFRLFLK